MGIFEKLKNALFEEEYVEVVEKPKTKKVIQLKLSGDTVKIWNSAREASEELNISISLIRDCSLGKQKTTKGFIFMYLKDYMGK